MTIHYELMLIYHIGFNPSYVIKRFGISRGSAYRFHRIYREARKRSLEMLRSTDSVSPGRERKTKNLDHLKKKKGRPPDDTWKWEYERNGTIIARAHKESKPKDSSIRNESKEN